MSVVVLGVIAAIDSGTMPRRCSSGSSASSARPSEVAYAGSRRPTAECMRSGWIDSRLAV